MMGLPCQEKSWFPNQLLNHKRKPNLLKKYLNFLFIGGSYHNMKTFFKLKVRAKEAALSLPGTLTTLLCSSLIM